MIQGQRVSGRRNCKGKGPEASRSVTCLRNGTKPRRLQSEQGRQGPTHTGHCRPGEEYLDFLQAPQEAAGDFR